MTEEEWVEALKEAQARERAEGAGEVPAGLPVRGRCGAVGCGRVHVHGCLHRRELPLGLLRDGGGREDPGVLYEHNTEGLHAIVARRSIVEEGSLAVYVLPGELGGRHSPEAHSPITCFPAHTLTRPCSTNTHDESWWLVRSAESGHAIPIAYAIQRLLLSCNFLIDTAKPTSACPPLASHCGAKTAPWRGKGTTTQGPASLSVCTRHRQSSG